LRASYPRIFGTANTTVGSYALISRESNEVQLAGITATDLALSDFIV